jgi:hypothetical protein
MPLSPGLYIRDLEQLPDEESSGVRIAIIGTASKGPVNQPVLVRSEQDFINKFGRPNPNYYLGYAALTALEAGLPIYVERVAVADEPGMPDDLRQNAIDLSGAREQGWGRIPVFAGRDFGRLKLRIPTVDEPFAFHEQSSTFLGFVDLIEDPTYGATSGAVSIGGSYNGDRDEIVEIRILSAPSSDLLDGAEYSIVRVRDELVLGSGSLVATAPGLAQVVSTSMGVTLSLSVFGAPLNDGDVFSIELHPDNRDVNVWVDRSESGGSPQYESLSFNDGENFHDPESFADRFNGMATGNKVRAVWDGSELYIVSEIPGDSIQLIDSAAWAMEVGQSPLAYDIPKGHLISAQDGPFGLSTDNNQVVLEFSNGDNTFQIRADIPITMSSVADIADIIDQRGVYAGSRVFRAYPLEIAESSYHLCIELTHEFADYSMQLMADNQHLKVKKFADLIEMSNEEEESRPFYDPRPVLPSPSENLDVPESCTSSSPMCIIDAAYYRYILGWFVASSPGTWVEDYELRITRGDQVFGVQRYNIYLVNDVAETVHQVLDISFDPNDERFVASVLNASIDQDGDAFIRWIERPTYLDTPEQFEPYEFTSEFFGGIDGVPTDPVYSSELDRVVIGRADNSTGLFAFQNHESIDVDVLSAPGFTSGAVIGEGIQIAQWRGDCIYLIDAPYGLSPQQVIQWHNGMLLSDFRQAINSSFAALYYSWVKQYDKYNRRDVWVPPSCYVNRQLALMENPWSAPAGLQRGRLADALDIEYDTTLGERDFMYSSGNAVNPLIHMPGEGIVIWGQKTLQRSLSALSYVNVRLLMNMIVQLMRYRMRRFVFAQNDAITRSRITTVSEMLFDELRSRNAIFDYRLVCDETNNTSERVSRNELWISVFVKPSRAAEVIELSVNMLTNASLLNITVV